MVLPLIFRQRILVSVVSGFPGFQGKYVWFYLDIDSTKMRYTGIIRYSKLKETIVENLLLVKIGIRAFIEAAVTFPSCNT